MLRLADRQTPIFLIVKSGRHHIVKHFMTKT